MVLVTEGTGMHEDQGQRGTQPSHTAPGHLCPDGLSGETGCVSPRAAIPTERVS